jgi:2-polyprenyl-6-methoxyphenol hydroxylase-like FAD-dependent oxidoreductase
MARGGHAVIVGASVAGLLAAKALSESYQRVTVLERDELSDRPAPRRGVPQSRQLHVLLARGAQVLEQLFPGLTDELIAAGAVTSDPQVDCTYYIDGRPLAPAPSGMTIVGVSRPLLEHAVRRRVSVLPNVEIRHATAEGLLLDDEHATVTGVLADTARLAADLVVDAAGRSSLTLRWLREAGLPDTPSSRVDPHVVYVTRHYRWEPRHLDGRNGLLCVPYPGMPRGAAMMRVENGRLEVVLFGLLDQNPGTTESDMLAFADSLPVPDVAKLMREAEPLDEAVLMRYPSSVRRHAERARRHVDGLVAVGDALCSFNPSYGQGMSVAAMEALLLRDLTRDGTQRLPARYYPAAAKLVDTAWVLAAGGDLRFPEIEGRRGAVDRVVNRYLDRYRRAASVDPTLARTFIEVANMVTPASAMLSPGQVVRTFRAASRRPTAYLPGA